MFNHVIKTSCSFISYHQMTNYHMIWWKKSHQNCRGVHYILYKKRSKDKSKSENHWFFFMTHTFKPTRQPWKSLVCNKTVIIIYERKCKLLIATWHLACLSLQVPTTLPYNYCPSFTSQTYTPRTKPHHH